MKIHPLQKKELKNLNPNYIEGVNSVHLALLLTDFQFDPAELTSKLNIIPTDLYIISENRESDKKRKQFEYNSWEYEEKIQSNDFLGDLADNFILNVLQSKLEVLKNLTKECQIFFRVVQYYNQSHNPGFSLNKQSLKTLTEIEAEFELDIYCIYDEEKTMAKNIQ